MKILRRSHLLRTPCDIYEDIVTVTVPKQHNNALNVHKITHKRAKSQKIRALDGRFSTNARLDGHALYRRTTWSHSRDKGEMVLRRG